MCFRIALMIGLLSVPATAGAQTWTACIDPEAGGLAPDGYHAVWEAAAASRMTMNSRSFALTRASRLAGSEGPTGFMPVQLELMRAGVSPIIIRFDPGAAGNDAPVAERECFAISLGDHGVGLWHLPAFYFPAGSADLEADQIKALAYVVVDYKPGISIVKVDGYSDTAGSTEESQALSELRAEFIVRALVRLGVRWSDIEARSHGETNLARPTADGVAEGLNRRVTVDIRTRAPDQAAARLP